MLAPVIFKCKVQIAFLERKKKKKPQNKTQQISIKYLGEKINLFWNFYT